MATDLEAGSLHEALRGAGFVPARGRATLSAGAASAEDAHLLGVAPGTPLLVERRVIVDLGGRPLDPRIALSGRPLALDVDFEVEGARDRAARGRGQG